MARFRAGVGSGIRTRVGRDMSPDWSRSSHPDKMSPLGHVSRMGVEVRGVLFVYKPIFYAGPGLAVSATVLFIGRPIHG